MSSSDDESSDAASPPAYARRAATSSGDEASGTSAEAESVANSTPATGSENSDAATSPRRTAPASSDDSEDEDDDSTNEGMAGPLPVSPNRFQSCAVFALDFLDVLLFIAGVATHLAFIVDVARLNYTALAVVSGALLVASWLSFAVAVCAYPETCLHPSTESLLLRLNAAPRVALVIVLSPVLPALTWLHWKLGVRALNLTDNEPHSQHDDDPEGADVSPQPVKLLREFEASDGVRRIAHSIAALKSAPRRLLLLDAADALARCAVQFAAITFTSGSTTQYVAVVVSMVTVLSKAPLLCDRSTHVSTFAFKVALAAFDLFAMFYTFSVQRYLWGGEEDQIWMLVWAAVPGLFLVPGLLILPTIEKDGFATPILMPWGGPVDCSCQLFVGIPLWLLSYAARFPSVFLLLSSAKLSYGFLSKRFLDFDFGCGPDPVEARRLLVNFVRQRGDKGREMQKRVVHVLKWYKASTGESNDRLDTSIATGVTPDLLGCTSRCQTLGCAALLVVPVVVVGLLYPVVHFSTYFEQHTTMSVTLFGCMLFSLGVAALLSPNAASAAYVNCVMEPAFQKTSYEEGKYGIEPANWTLADAWQCVSAYFVVPAELALPRGIRR